MERPEDDGKARLEAVGFTYIASSACWINRSDGRVISAAKVAAHDPDWLAHWIARTPRPN